MRIKRRLLREITGETELEAILRREEGLATAYEKIWGMRTREFRLRMLIHFIEELYSRNMVLSRGLCEKLYDEALWREPSEGITENG